MLAFRRGCENRSFTYDVLIACVATAAVLFEQTDTAQSAVFEELDNGMIVVMTGGISADTLSGYPEDQSPVAGSYITVSLPAVLAGETKEESAPAAPMGGVLLDLAPARTLALKANSPRKGLPAPSEFAKASFSHRQKEMRALTADVALRYASSPGVTRANLDEGAFVDLFTAMIHRESNFNPHAVSPAGARGLGQLMPATAKELGVEDVFSAKGNLEGSAQYLTTMLEQFGTPELALAAYNAGPGAVKRYGGVPPYRETRQYVADIINATTRGSKKRRSREQSEIMSE